MDSPKFNSLLVSDLYSFESYIFTTGDFFSQPMKNTSKDNTSNPILHKDGSKSVITKEDQELTKDIGQKQYPIDNGQNTNSTVNQEIGEPGTGSQATKGNTNIDGLLGDFGSQDSSAGQTSGDKSLRRFGTGSNSIA